MPLCQISSSQTVSVPLPFSLCFYHTTTVSDIAHCCPSLCDYCLPPLRNQTSLNTRLLFALCGCVVEKVGESSHGVSYMLVIFAQYNIQLSTAGIFLVWWGVYITFGMVISCGVSESPLLRGKDLDSFVYKLYTIILYKPGADRSALPSAIVAPMEYQSTSLPVRMLRRFINAIDIPV